MDAVVEYMAAVQAHNLDRLYCLSTGAAGPEEPGGESDRRRDDFRAWAEAQYDAYSEGRDLGRIELEDNGILVCKAFALGKGTFVSYGPPRSSGADSVRLVTELRLGYGQLDLSRLSPGTTFYLSGTPVGRILPVRVPSRPTELTLDVLDTLKIEWTLVRGQSTERCPDVWTVAGARPLPESATTLEATWNF